LGRKSTAFFLITQEKETVLKVFLYADRYIPSFESSQQTSIAEYVCKIKVLIIRKL